HLHLLNRFQLGPALFEPLLLVARGGRDLRRRLLLRGLVPGGGIAEELAGLVEGLLLQGRLAVALRGAGPGPRRRRGLGGLCALGRPARLARLLLAAPDLDLLLDEEADLARARGRPLVALLRLPVRCLGTRERATGERRLGLALLVGGRRPELRGQALGVQAYRFLPRPAHRFAQDLGLGQRGILGGRRLGRGHRRRRGHGRGGRGRGDRR